MVKEVENARSLIEEGLITIDQLKDIIVLSGGNIEAAFDHIRQFTDIIRRDGADMLISLPLL